MHRTIQDLRRDVSYSFKICCHIKNRSLYLIKSRPETWIYWKIERKNSENKLLYCYSMVTSHSILDTIKKINNKINAVCNKNKTFSLNIKIMSINFYGGSALHINFNHISIIRCHLRNFYCFFFVINPLHFVKALHLWNCKNKIDLFWRETRSVLFICTISHIIVDLMLYSVDL